ncbi:uncharacterized protein LOC123562881 [Mercenaria mercenaria]|uniref:uncharacterized protein LOC123562881 n=1 Tax=Mercenaria mercenaria TaxID=6596 RepID=UPI00234E4EE8|nr:uncharacterized protein LOC123562881 [Mercenaria mercenaria]
MKSVSRQHIDAADRDDSRNVTWFKYLDTLGGDDPSYASLMDYLAAGKQNRYLYENFTVSSKKGDVIKSLDGVDLYMQSRFMAKYLDTETTHYLRDSASFLAEFGPDVAALHSDPVDLLLPSGKTVVKTVKKDFSLFPRDWLDNFSKPVINTVSTIIVILKP